MPLSLVLASTSPYRKELLARLQLPFTTDAPNVDETALPEETPSSLVQRLSLLKAQALMPRHPNSLIIGSDQVAVCQGRIITKPGSHANAVAQLTSFSEQRIEFLTGLCVLNALTGESQILLEPYNVYFRQLSQDTIEKYLIKERPYNCAGSFKSEGLGTVLFERLEGDDPTALIGLPMIRLIQLLKYFKFPIL